MNTSRRLFIKQFTTLAGCFASSAGIFSCANPAVRINPGQSQRFIFPQGIASSDPQPDAILLWTRIIDQTGPGPVKVTMQLSLDEKFKEIIADIVGERQN